MSLADEFAPPRVPRSVNTYLVGDCAAAGAASAAASDMTANRRLVAVENSLRISGLLRACAAPIGPARPGFPKRAVRVRNTHGRHRARGVETAHTTPDARLHCGG